MLSDVRPCLNLPSVTNLDTEREGINIDNADMLMGEDVNGAMFSTQSSRVTAGCCAGVEALIFGVEGAIQVRLAEEFDVIQTNKSAKLDVLELIPPPTFPGRVREAHIAGADRPQGRRMETS